MKHFSIQIDSRLLASVLQAIFDNLPTNYLSALNKYLKEKPRPYYRESLISGWIQIPVRDGIIFKEIIDTIRFVNLFFDTAEGEFSEVRVYLNKNGIIGIYVKEDLEKLIPSKIDVSKCLIEEVPVSKFLNTYTDLEYLQGFEEIDNFLDDKSSCEVYSIDESLYYSIITLSDKKCIAFNSTNSIFLIDKFSGSKKMISSDPKSFSKSFLNNEFAYMFSSE